MTARSFSVAHKDGRIQYTNGSWSESTDESSQPSYHTSDQYALATFEFDGVMISVSGTLSSNSESKNPGLFLVFDGKNDSSHVLNYTGLSSNTLYTSDFLSPGHHTLAMTLMTNDTTLFIQGMNVTVMNEGITADAAADDRSYAAAQRTRVGEIVGGTLGGLTFIALILVSFFLYRRRKLQRAKVTYPLGPLRASMPTSKEAFTSPKYNNYGISFTTSADPSTDSFTILPPKAARTRRTADAQMTVTTMTMSEKYRIGA